MSFSINKLNSHLLFTCKNLCFMILCGKNVLLQEMEHFCSSASSTSAPVLPPLLLPPAPLSLRPCIVLKDRPHHLTNYKYKGTKISIFNLFSELGKICKCNVGFSKIPISHLFYGLGKTWKYTQPQTNISNSKCWICGWVGKTYVLIYTSLLKIRWGIHIKEDGHISNLT